MYTSDSVPLLRVAVSLMVGIVVDYYFQFSFSIFPVFVCSLILAFLLWHYAYWQSVAICFCVFILGSLLMQHQRTTNQIIWPEGEIYYEAVVLSEPVEKPKTIAVDVLMLKNGKKIKCYISKDKRSRSLKIGDGLRIQSRIKNNREWHIGNFDYKRYLEIHGFAGNTFISRSKWHLEMVSLEHISRLERAKIFFLKKRSQLLGRLKIHDTDNEAYAVVAAMTLGDKSELSKELKEVYSVTGASHVLALSGLHIGILYMLLSLLIVGHRWKSFSLLTIVLAIWAFVFLVGLPTSVVRSAIMLTTYALLSLGRRDKMSVNTLAFAAIILLLINPYSLFDVGFQMSFVAVFSILVWLPLFEKFVSMEFLMKHRCLKWIWGIVSVSFAAQIGVAPLIAYYFGRISTYFLLTNFVVIPAAMLILYLSIVVLTIPSLAYLLLYIASTLNSALKWIAHLPGSSIEGLHPSVLQTVMIYVIIIALYCLIRILGPAMGWLSSRRA